MTACCDIVRHREVMTINALGDMFEQSTDAVFGIDATGVIRFTNRSFEQLMGYSAKQLR